MAASRDIAKQFYKSNQWRKCREGYIKSVFGICERCGGNGYIVHHKIHIDATNVNDADVLLSWDNLEYLCLDCHNKHHRFNRAPIQTTREGLQFNSNGELIEV